MPRAFADVAEINVFGDRLNTAADQAPAEARRFIATASQDTAARMRLVEIPVDEGETRDSVTIEADQDGLAASIGPTNTDAKGKPVGFFIEHGTDDTDPDPFAMRTANWAARTLPEQAEQIFKGIL